MRCPDVIEYTNWMALLHGTAWHSKIFLMAGDYFEQPFGKNLKLDTSYFIYMFNSRFLFRSQQCFRVPSVVAAGIEPECVLLPVRCRCASETTQTTWLPTTNNHQTSLKHASQLQTLLVSNIQDKTWPGIWSECYITLSSFATSTFHSAQCRFGPFQYFLVVLTLVAPFWYSWELFGAVLFGICWYFSVLLVFLGTFL